MGQSVKQRGVQQRWKERWLAAAFLVVAAVLFVAMGGHGAEAAELEQVHINSPVIRLYLREGDSALTNEKEPLLSFDDTELEYQKDAHRYDPEKDGGTEYIYVVEISRYVTKNQRREIEKALKKAVDKLGASDEMRVYTFGDRFAEKPPVKLNGGTSPGEKTKAKESIHTLMKVKEKTSHLWNAVTNIVDQINKRETGGPERRVAVFVTGGNFKKTTSNNDKEDAGKQIGSMTKNGAFYMIQLKTKSKVDGSEASVFTESGGEKYSERADGGIAACFQKFQNAVDKTTTATFRATDSTVFDEAGQLTLKSGEEAIFEKKRIAAAVAWQENSSNPVLVSDTEGSSDYITKQDDQRISFVFSEPVKGAELIQNYRLTRGDGKNVEIRSIQYDVKTRQCTLMLEQQIFADRYHLKLSNITDIDHMPLSVEPSEIDFKMDGASERTYQFIQFIRNYWWIILIAFVVVILLVVYIVIRSHGGIIEQQDGKKGFANATTVTVGISTAKTKKVLLQMTDSVGKTKDIICNIDSSIFVGRDKMCQIHTDDDKMSRQHFAIESTQLGFFVMDLDTLNGTTVNGTKLTSRQMLKEGDVISAGREKFVFSLYKGE